MHTLTHLLHLEAIVESLGLDGVWVSRTTGFKEDSQGPLTAKHRSIISFQKMHWSYKVEQRDGHLKVVGAVVGLLNLQSPLEEIPLLGSIPEIPVGIPQAGQGDGHFMVVLAEVGLNHFQSLLEKIPLLGSIPKDPVGIPQVHQGDGHFMVVLAVVGLLNLQSPLEKIPLLGSIPEIPVGIPQAGQGDGHSNGGRCRGRSP